MTVAIMQPYVFPYIGYYQLVYAAEKFIFLDDVNYINKGWINRNNLLVNNKKTGFTIPLKDASQNRLINEIVIADKNALNKILKTIELAYKKAPYFNSVYQVIESVFRNSGTAISDIAKESIKKIFSFLEIEKVFTDSSVAYNNKQLKGQERIIDISRIEKATEYINLMGGMELYNQSDFLSQNIQLHFIKAKEIKYKQWGDNFEPFLSIIDVLMFNSIEDSKKMFTEYDIL